MIVRRNQDAEWTWPLGQTGLRKKLLEIVTLTWAVRRRFGRSI